MAGVLDGIEQRTTMVGRNRLELLLFRLGGRQRFGINVFKVREVIKCPPLTRVPNPGPGVRGICHLRDQTVTVMDLNGAIGGPPVEDVRDAYIILTEFNRSVQGFLVAGVDRIININWEDVLPPPRGAGRNTYVTSITRVDGELVEIIDVEEVLARLLGALGECTDATTSIESAEGVERKVLVADDSSVARAQIRRTLERLGIAFEMAKNGREAWDMLSAMADEAGAAPIEQRIGMVISDVEMPEMDGYTLTKHIKDDARLKGLYVLLHTSLSGVFNNAMVQKVGADEFLAKFNGDELARSVTRRLDPPLA